MSAIRTNLFQQQRHTGRALAEQKNKMELLFNENDNNDDMQTSLKSKYSLIAMCLKIGCDGK